ncbi:hypothetical protein G7046_g9208 [Stylonectria norvegica]|nr:hypothetical protein G7046_g9208 [Stylonectria norvegica]
MASMDPSEEEISQVIDFASLDPLDDRHLVKQALRNNNRNVEVVVMEYFDDPENFRQRYRPTWDESVFAAERDGTENKSGIAFHIESPNQNEVIHGVTPPSESYAQGAPSRPPSRTNNRSPLSRAVDWKAETVPVIQSSQTQEDEDMQRALRESAQEAGITMKDHESGIVTPSASAPHFGPANRDVYDTQDWSMVPTGPAQVNENTTPAPSMRKRAAGAPAFLVQGICSGGDHRLGGLLTIYNQIPLARNTLLRTGSPAASYGHNSEWWKGQEILPPHVLAQMQSGDLQWGNESSTKPDFDEELHRLMAFLDSTERSYGTISVLTDLIPYLGCAERQFFEEVGARNGEKIVPLMQVATLANSQDDGSSFDDARFGLLEMDHAKSEYDVLKTLYEALDQVMWGNVLSWDKFEEESQMGMFEEMGEIFTIRIGNEGPTDSLEVPEVLYPERYLASRQLEARRIQAGWYQTKKDMARITNEQKKMYEQREAHTGQILDKREWLKKATDQWKGYDGYLESLGSFHSMEESDFDTTKYPDYRAAPCNPNAGTKKFMGEIKDTIQYTEDLLTNLEERMRGLNDELELVKKRQRFLGRLLTVPDKLGRQNPMTCKKYLLRGVYTSLDVIYVCQRLEPELIDLGDSPEPLDQWWRLAYAPSEDPPVKAEKVEVERVLRDMWQETKTPLLVYATEGAMQTPRVALSGPLERFMKAENKAFRQELNQEKAASQEITTFTTPLSPSSKRKHRSDSLDSMDSNRASIGSEDRSGFENPFADQIDSAGTEMTDASLDLPEFARNLDLESQSTITELTPLLPNGQPASTNSTSATMTPSTMMVDDGDFIADSAHSQSGSHQAEVTVTPIEGSKSPEMQERGRPLSYMHMPSNSPERQKAPDLMDMEVLEH